MLLLLHCSMIGQPRQCGQKGVRFLCRSLCRILYIRSERWLDQCFNLGLLSRPCQPPVTARVIVTPAQADSPVSTVPQSVSVSTICQGQSFMMA